MKRKSLLVKIIKSVVSMKKLLTVDPCEKNACRNGGTCVGGVGKRFTCLCPPHYTGKTCESDLNECEMYNGTVAGCQNNGTCTNKPGGFECTCPQGYHGPLCQYKMSSCSRTFELCGPHGHCVDIDNTDSTTKYKCLCDWGYKVSSDLNNPTCVDVNECESNPCHPGVACINLPGSFQCSGCPSGYKTEGSSCVDINECDAEIPPCDPLSSCINTIGSFQCQPCPPGYSGDGTTCVKEDVCANNRCNELATCKFSESSMNAGGYVCICPEGYVGDGLGLSGCTKSNSSACLQHNCVNGGKCKPVNDRSYFCECGEHYSGRFCEQANPCAFKSCPGGRCVVTAGVGQCVCPERFYGKNCENEEIECDRHFNEGNGNFTFARENNSTSICEFTFDIPSIDSVLKINFTNFDEFTQIEPGITDCQKTTGNLTLYDGINDNSPLLDTFCGDHNSVKAPLISHPITMTASRAFLRFRGSSGTFSIKWETVQRSCGYRTTKPEGILEVPDNKEDAYCEWFISAPATKVIEVKIPSIEMSTNQSFNCARNKLEIYDGYSSYDAHRISQICSSTLDNQMVRSTGPHLVATFFAANLLSAKQSSPIRGFHLSYRFVDPDRVCGGEFVNTNDDFDFSGVIESPNFGSLYPPNMDCTWIINASLHSNFSNNDGFQLKFTTDLFDVNSSYLSILPRSAGPFFSYRRIHPFGYNRFNRYFLDSRSCADDYLRIYDSNHELKYDACNSHKLPAEFVVPDSETVLRFHSNGALQGKGFKMAFELQCEQTFSGNGSFSSWNFPLGGRAGKCTYIIRAPKTHVIHLKFKTIGLQVLRHHECFYSTKPIETYPNYVEFEGGRVDNNVFNRRYVCPKYPFLSESSVTVAASRPLKITVVSDGDPNFKGVSMEYTTTHVGCGGFFSASSGTISSPNYPEKYHPHMHCVYDIYASWSRRVKLSFETFDLETTTSPNCLYDRVEIYTKYVNETNHGKLIGKFCGTLLPPAVFSDTNTMSVVFISDRSVSGVGFTAKYESVDRNVICDQTFTAPSGEITFYDDEHRFSKCVYHIAVEDNQRILIKLNNISVPCSTSRLNIYNGPLETSPGFSELFEGSQVCNSHPMTSIRSFSNRVLIVFSSTDTRENFFNISYEVASIGCGGRVDGLSGSVSAPQYPLTDGRQMLCEWTVAVALGNRVLFSIAALDDLKSSDPQGFCPLFAQNRLDILDSPHGPEKLLRRYCRKEIAPEPILSDDNEILIRYRQIGGFTNGKIFGFLGHFRTICTGIVLTDPIGSIQSPGYPYKVYTVQYCTWQIQAPKGNRIVARFHNFLVDNSYVYSKDCDKNGLKIDDTTFGEAEVRTKESVNVTSTLNKFCDSTGSPITIKSKHNVMKLTYRSNQQTNKFWLSWNMIGCIADIRVPQNIIIQHDDLDLENTDEFECQYKIVAPIGKKIQIQINQFQIIARSKNCTYSQNEGINGIAFFMGTSNSSGIAPKTICESVENTSYDSHMNEMFIYISLNKNNLISSEWKVFFNASVKFLDIEKDDCGGTIDLKVGQITSIHSPNYPQAYPPAIVCNWLFKAPLGYHIEYTLKEFHSPNYHEEKQQRVRIESASCYKYIGYSDGLLTAYFNSSDKSAAVMKFCAENDNSTTFEVNSSESLVSFMGASNLMGTKSGETRKNKVGFVLTATPKCGGIHYADSEPQTISMYHQGEKECIVTIRKKDPKDPNILVRIDEYTRMNVADSVSVEDRLEVFVEEIPKAIIQIDDETRMQEFSAKNEIRLKVNHASAPHTAIITFSTDIKSCGGTLRHNSNLIRLPPRFGIENVDCVYTLENTHSNLVQLEIQKLKLAPSKNCTVSYLEIREFNSTGKLLGRVCNNDYEKYYISQSIWLLLRHVVRHEDDPDYDYDSSSNLPTAEFEAKLFRITPELTLTRKIVKPITDRPQLATIAILSPNSSLGILIKFQKVFLVNSSSFLRFSQSDENDHIGDSTYKEVTGIGERSDIFLPYSIVYVYAKFDVNDDYQFTWDNVPMDYLETRNNTNQTDHDEYDCGGVLRPNWDWQTISNPLPPGQHYGYEENMRCRWIIERPLFAGVKFEFEFLDLEYGPNCPFDYVAFVVGNEADDMPSLSNVGQRFCNHHTTSSIAFSVNKFVNVIFVSDKSRHGKGFKLKYTLTCSSFEHIRPGAPFEHTMTSPTYPDNNNNRDFECQWSLILETNRKLLVTVIDMDIEGEEPCKQDNALILGFKILISEVIAECPSGVLQLNENTPLRYLRSPNWPEMIPHSTECEYVIAAPNGRRVALTFNNENFQLEEKDGECTDFVEVRDGPTAESALIGAFCGVHPPSTIYSSANLLYVRLHTSQFENSPRLEATYEIATCGGTVVIRNNQTTRVTSPNYPEAYPNPMQCQWTIRSPNSHLLLAKVDHLWVSYNQNCTIDKLTIRDGNSTADPLFRPLCNGRDAPDVWTRSSSSLLTMQFESNSTAAKGGRQYCKNRKCGFDVEFKLSETKCGGKISAKNGIITPPGYPGKLLPKVKCVWNLEAPPGFVYRLRLNFTNTDGWQKSVSFGMVSSLLCLNDLTIFEGTAIDGDYTQMSYQFCNTSTQYTMSSDIGRIEYDDIMTRKLMATLREVPPNSTFYAPFAIHYDQIPADTSPTSCSALINSNRTFNFRTRQPANKTNTFNTAQFCHLKIQKPKKFGSTWIKIGEMLPRPDGIKLRICMFFDQMIYIQSKSPVPVNFRSCEAIMKTNYTELVYVNPDIDVYVKNSNYDTHDQSFKLIVEFQQCGGYIKSPNTGKITSPNYGPGRNYLPNSRCKWIIEALEGQIVKVTIREMKISYNYECTEDHLIIGEGKQGNPIHKYCHRIDGVNEMKLDDRFKVIKSNSRYLTLTWTTDDDKEDAGFELEYEFVNEQNTCGFHTQGMSGVVHTPDFGEKDYENQLECVWDVQVPLGYHINLHFTHFDVETSEKCVKDQLVISQEHSSRANSPLGDYYFLFQDEEKREPICGIITPPDIVSESNRVRLNFTTDEFVTGRGFRVEWKAECGTVFRLNHGVVSSPNYPDGYPNDNKECLYYIQPADGDLFSVVSIKFMDFDLSEFTTSYGRYPCDRDYVEIIEVLKNRTHLTICGGQDAPAEALSIRGPVGVRFSVGSQYWRKDGPNKMHRGFQLSYSINKCGGDIVFEDEFFSKTLTSPAFPLEYVHSLNCVWTIKAPSDRIIDVKIELMDLEYHDDCSADYVEFFDSADVRGNKSLAKVCWANRKAISDRIQSTGNEMAIQFVTDETVKGGGFKLVATATLGPKAGCGGVLKATDEWNILSPPKGANGDYPGGLRCGWTISGPINSKIEMILKNIDTEPLQFLPGGRPDSVCIDALTIYDGRENFSPVLLGDICEDTVSLPLRLVSSHRHVFLKFESDDDGSGKGFNISYRTLDSECGGWLTAQSEPRSVVFHSRPLNDTNEIQRCRYMIEGNKMAPIIVRFNHIFIMSKDDCSESYVEIRDVGSLNECQHPACAREPSQRKVTRYCGMMAPPPHISNTNVVQIIVAASIRPNKRAALNFSYELLDNCNRTIVIDEEPSGRLTSPNYPNSYSSNSTCLTKLQTKSRVLIAFSKFNLEGHRTPNTELCEFDYLEVTTSENTNRYCGPTTVPTIFTNGENVDFLFKSDHSSEHDGYDATYFKVEKYADDLVQFYANYDREGIVTNIGYPKGYNKSSTQIFFINPPFSHTCEFEIVSVGLGITSDVQKCEAQDEYLDFELMGTITKKARIRDCSFETGKKSSIIPLPPDTLRMLKITFHSDDDPTNDGRGFAIKWRCQDYVEA
ncbi:unnamed protein product [Caenorhabditis bovis]|uniref:Cubilin n=1 Tax=Caenorhabditis bovis TaxID=2654633 RepID=A0A8S1EFN5_9PELO|nr:unnamed protein product [Caenorhabditis bovis]